MGSGKPPSPWEEPNIDNVDEKKLRRKIEEHLRKEATTEAMIEFAAKHRIDIPTHPQTPPDYHDEPGRPHFGPHQVRHASDLKVGEDYFEVWIRKGKSILKTRVRLNAIRYRCNKWWMNFIHLDDNGNETDWGSGWIPLSLYNLHPAIEATSNSNEQGWDRNNYLEFALPEQDCGCANQPPADTTITDERY